MSSHTYPLTDDPAGDGERAEQARGTGAVLPRLLGGRYLLEEEIATGGMASVWRAHDEKLARTVAVKVLHQHLSNAEDFRERFRREAVSAAKLSHPGIVSVYDTGSDAGWVYMVMEYVPGPTLADVMADHAPMDVATVAGIGQSIAEALHVANQLGVVHRDVKPANILITPSGAPKVTDFGIAKAEDAVGDLTGTGMVLGTAAYVAPEQIRGHALDHRADQYGLGCVLYEALTGHKPFTADSTMEVAAQRLKTDPLDIRALRTDLSKDVTTVVMRALRRDPADRHVDNATFAEALAPFATRSVTPLSGPAGFDHQLHDDPGAHRDLDDSGGPILSNERSFFRSEGRWLGIVLALLVATGVLVGVGLQTGVLNADGIPSLPALEVSQANENRAATDEDVEPLVPPADQLSALDPAGDGENGDMLPLAVDSDTSTAWQTETYFNRADFGGLKDGVGIVVDVGEPRPISGTTITTTTPGITVQLMASDTGGSDLSEWRELTSPQSINDNDVATIRIEPTEARYVMLWITGDLVSVGEDRWRADIAEFALLTPPA